MKGSKEKTNREEKEETDTTAATVTNRSYKGEGKFVNVCDSQSFAQQQLVCENPDDGRYS